LPSKSSRGGSGLAFALADVPMQRRAFFISRKGFSTDGNHYQRLRFPMEGLKVVFKWKDYRSHYC
jgi:hypothetical protein